MQKFERGQGHSVARFQLELSKDILHVFVNRGHTSGEDHEDVGVALAPSDPVKRLGFTSGKTRGRRPLGPRGEFRSCTIYMDISSLHGSKQRGLPAVVTSREIFYKGLALLLEHQLSP